MSPYRVRALAPEWYGPRARAAPPVGLYVAGVVYDEDGAREQPHGHRQHEGLPGHLLGLHVVGAGHRDDAEEEEDEDLAEALVAVRARAAGVEHAGEDRRGADGQQDRAGEVDEVDAAEHGQ